MVDLVNSTDHLSTTVESLGKQLLAAIFSGLIGILAALIAALVAYIQNSTRQLQQRAREHSELKDLRVQSVALQKENVEVKKQISPKSSGSM